MLPTVRGAPHDPFTAALPARDTQAPDAGEVSAGDGSVDASSGTAAYALPIVVPPGRAGLAPSLSLRYSSQGGLRGGPAVGWSFDVGVIEKDSDVLAGTAYRVRFNGTSERLVAVTGDPWNSFSVTYRAERDDTFTRYVYNTLAQSWTAFTLDGRVHTFGAANAGTRWHLTQTRDRFDNRIDYTYAWTTVTPLGLTYGEQELVAIEYGANPAASLAAHARIDLVRSPVTSCGGVPVGASLDHHFGALRVSGARAIDRIDVKVRTAPGATWTLRRRHQLVYDGAPQACDAGALRYLSRVEVTAYDPLGAATVVPPVSFTYGLPTRALTTSFAVPSFGGGERGENDGPTSTLMDVDGDGWIDRLTIHATTRCILLVNRGTGPGTFSASTTWINLPSAQWYNATSPQGIEGCSLTAQVADRGITGNGGPACRTHSAQVTYGFQDWDGDGRVDIVSHLHQTYPGSAGGDYPLGSFGPGAPVGPTGGGNGAPPSCPAATPTPEQDGFGSFVVRVQRNLGNLTFQTFANATLVASPVALPAGPTNISVDTVARPSLPSMVDVTGDGLVDAISLVPNPSSPPSVMPLLGASTTTTLYVWPGTGGASFGARQSWPLPAWSQSWQVPTSNPSNGYYESPGTVNVADHDGDGLADLIVTLASTGQIAVVRSTGPGGFRAPVAIGVAGAVDLSRAEFPPSSSLPWSITSGARATIRQITDADADGLPEYVVNSYAGGVTANGGHTVWSFFGGGQTGQRVLGSTWEALERLVVASNGTWYRASDLLDVTGDGIPEFVYHWSATGGATVHTDAQDGVLAPRLLARVDNGRGAVTRYEYGRSTDPFLVALAGRPLGARHVVRRVIVEGGAGTPAMTTTYQYADPRLGKDSWRATGRDGFLGFASVTIDKTGSVGAASERTVQQYTFPAGGADLRPVLAQEWTYAYVPSAGTHAPIRMKQITTWEHPLLDGGPSFRFPRTTVERTCAAGATETTCTSAPERTRTTTVTMTPYRETLTGPIRHYQATRTDVTATGTPASHTATTYQVRSTTTEYVQEVSDVQHGDGTSVLARQGFVLDSRLVQTESRRYYDATNYARTQWTIDGVGNKTVEVKPRQVASGGAGTWFSYDAHRVLPAGSTNELWHTVYETRDVATGALLERRGPNWRYGADEAGVTGYWYETERWTIDGLGRVRTHLASFDPPAGSASTTYVLRQVEAVTYVDATVPNRRTSSRTQTLGTADAIVRETAHDGLGRVIEEIDRRQVAGAPDAVTTYVYDAAGALVEMRVPDPRVDTGVQVTYAWQRDGLGRPVNVLRPDGSGEEVTYAGASTSIRERKGPGVYGGTTVLVVDGRGVLAEVLEPGNPQPARYAYDALGRSATMTDATGHVTSFGYDWRGLRTAITRGTRTWRYRYDLDGNLTEEETPRPTGSTAAAYTSTTAYDVLGRVASRTPALRDQSPALRDALGIGASLYTYDTGRLGALARIEHPTAIVDFTHDARGLVKREARTFDLPDWSFTVAQHVDRTYDATGAPLEVTWNDGTAWRYTYDRRGLTTQVAWRPAGGATWVPLAGFTRGVAGAARQRDGHDQRRAHLFDALGRVTYDRVSRVSTNGTYGERNYGYDGDDLVEVWGENDGVAADASYSYDLQHRITGASGPAAYNATLAYGPAGNVTSAHVMGALDVASRNVTYRYAAFDPQAVEALVSGGSDVTTLAYDEQGNLRLRTGSLAPPLDLTWDGHDQVRRAIGPGASERYLFGERGERLASIGPDGVKLWFGETETHYTSAGALVRRWHHVTADGQPVARIENGAAVELQYTDALSNLVLAIDQNGAVTAAFLYGVFGELASATGATTHRRQWNGKEADALTGLRHYGFRSYDPLLLRWISADPKYRFAPDFAHVQPQRANLYAFSLNNPLRYVDPDGLDGTCGQDQSCPIDAPPDPDATPAPGQGEDGAAVCDGEPDACSAVIGAGIAAAGEAYEVLGQLIDGIGDALGAAADEMYGPIYEDDSIMLRDKDTGEPIELPDFGLPPDILFDPPPSVPLTPVPRPQPGPQQPTDPRTPSPLNPFRGTTPKVKLPDGGYIIIEPGRPA